MTIRRPNPYVEAVLTSVIVVGVALIMQKPDLRQALLMKVWQTAHRFCLAQSEFWTNAAGHTATAYNKARL